MTEGLPTVRLLTDSLPFTVKFMAEVWSFDGEDLSLRAQLGGAKWEAEVSLDSIEGDLFEDDGMTRSIRVVLGGRR